MEHYDKDKQPLNNSEGFHGSEEASTEERDQSTEQEIVSASAAEQYESSKQKPERKAKNNWTSITVAGLMGGIISAIIVAVLFAYNIIPTNGTAENNNGSTNDSGPEVVETLATEDANVSANINEVAETVVGVINLQQQSVWTGNQEAGTGSGIIYKKEDGNAYVVTNQHVVDGAEDVEVVLNEDKRLPAKVLGEDSLTDLAVLQIDGEGIDTVANLGSSSDLQIGETVLAIGNPLGMEFANTVTRGIVSGLDRSVNVDTNRDGQADWITQVIQTDAAINPGNSGGALVNAEGEVIGINSMKVAEGTVEGIGFAIPIDEALPIMEQLETEGEVTRPAIGISIASLSQVPPQYRYEINLPDDIKGGMVIANVQNGSPADNAGLQQFDVITKINGQEVTNILDMRKYLYSETNVGDTVEIEYIRDGETETTNLKLEEMPQQEPAEAA